MPLPKEIVEDVMYLAMHSKQFQHLMAHWKKQEELLTTEILSPLTDPALRELKVNVRDLLNREVTQIVEIANKQLSEKKE